MTERNQAWNSLMHYTHHTFLSEELLSGLFFIIPFTNLMAIRIVAEKGFSAGVMPAEKPFSVFFLTAYACQIRIMPNILLFFLIYKKQKII